MQIFVFPLISLQLLERDAPYNPLCTHYSDSNSNNSNSNVVKSYLLNIKYFKSKYKNFLLKKKIENRPCSYINLYFLQFLAVSHYKTYTFYGYTYKKISSLFLYKS